MNRFVETGLYFLVGAAVGGVTGYFIAKKQAEARADAEIKNVKEHYSRKALKEDEEFQTLSKVFSEKYGDALDRLGYQGDPAELGKFFPDGLPEDSEEEVDEDEGGNPTTELPTKEDLFEQFVDQRRNDSKDPYIISDEEYNENEGFHEQITLKYYDECGTLTNEEDEPLPDKVRYVGESALDNFGVGSKDPEMVYVRNDEMEVDFEVYYHPKSYEEHVLGLKPDKERPLKMREDVGW